MPHKGEGSKQFTPEQKKSVPSSAETAGRLTKELFLPKTLAYIKNVIRKLSPGIQEADRDDTAQKILIDVNRNIQNGNFTENGALLTTYLFQTARNRILDLHRYTKGHPAAELDEFKIADSKTTVEDWIEKAYVTDMVSQLPARAQQVVKLKLQGHDENYIAEKLNMQIDTVKSIFSRAKKTLRKIIATDAEKNKL
ncbi:MAG: sigma-70 family RNA polymerase sigma factor [Patescibacteria group bacterium]